MDYMKKNLRQLNFHYIHNFGGELITRALGMIDLPIYDANSLIGYIPASNQQGSFLNSHDWQFNELHMGAVKFAPSRTTDILLIGDSIVHGGNPLSQSDRLGPQLQKATSKVIWPISAGSWSLRNELSYLRLNPDVLKQIDSIIFVLNSGDFTEASSWKCELTHPRKQPTSALWYILNKYVYSFECCDQIPLGLEVPPGNVWDELADLVKSTQLKPLYIIYPTKTETLNTNLRIQKFAANSEKLSSIGNRTLFFVAEGTRWSAEFYRDDIHPTAEGNAVLANIIKDAIQKHQINDAI